MGSRRVVLFVLTAARSGGVLLRLGFLVEAVAEGDAHFGGKGKEGRSVGGEIEMERAVFVLGRLGPGWGDAVWRTCALWVEW